MTHPVSSAPPLDGLNPAQREAVLHVDGPALVLAGAGSGKTRVLTTRIARLVGEHGVDPASILAVTFTNKAAGEMRERIERLLGRSTAGMWVGTFHAIGARMLRSAAALAGRSPNFTIYDEDDALGAVKRVMERQGISPKEYAPKSILSAISDAKNALVDEREYASLALDPFSKVVAGVYTNLEDALRTANAVTFDDLLVLPVRILQRNPERLAEYQRRFRYVLVDEYQDTNRAQYKFVTLLAGSHGNVMVVGDEDQCLAAGTVVTMADGSTRPIETIRPGDRVLSCYGSGDFRAAAVTRVYRRLGRREGIVLTTVAGRRIVSTAEHTHFAGYRLGTVPQTYFTYLMYREGVGYRLGTTQVYTQGQAKPTVGFAQRCRQERGDAVWIVSTHTSETDARAEEYILSLRHRIPTLPFVPRKTAARRRDGEPAAGLVHDEVQLARIFAAFDTESGARQLMADHGLSPQSPHFRPRSRNASRRNVVVTLCGDRRGVTPMHRISIVGNDEAGRAGLAALGLSVRPAKAGSASWRHETAGRSYAALHETIDRIGTSFDVNVIQVARLGRNDEAGEPESNSLPFTPASSVRPGMAMFDADGGYDIVASVERVVLDGPVHDLDIEGTHNYVANGIVTHNSVYGWRGADIRNILDFEKDFPAARVVRLEDNYRSAPPILELANEVISANTERLGKTLRATQPPGERVSVVNAADERDEADAVAEEIQARRSASGRLMLRDFAILYRTNAQSRAMEEAMRKRNIPYRLIGAVRFYDRREIRDLMAYLKLIANPADDEAFRRAVAVPKRGLGDTTIAQLADAAASHGLPLLATAERAELVNGVRPAARKALADFAALVGEFRERARDSSVDEILRGLIDAIRYADHLRSEGPEGAERLDNVRELVDSAAETVADEGGEVGLTPLDHFLQRATLAAGVDGLDPNADAVVMMTMHNAKGLEFPVVFVTGLEDGLFPLARAYDDPKMLEEERRLFYVGITRAERKLVLTHADQRRRNGELLPSKPSSFLAAIPRGMLDQRTTVRARSSGRAFLESLGERGAGGRGGRGSGGSWGRSSSRWDDAPAFGSSTVQWADDAPSPSARRAGTPVSRPAARPPADEDVSQDAAQIAVGARVRHARFGAGTIAELSGSGRDAKVRIDFDDEEIGRKTLVLAQANLEREWD